MKAAVILSLVSMAFAAGFEKRACAGNNCNRAVTGTREGLAPLASRSAGCAAYLATTVTPSPVTVTVTVTASAPAKLKRAVEARQTAPAVVPAWASAACDAAGFSSACGCLGVTATTATAATPTVTTTTTIDYCEDL